jgi:DNA invertase Pin-like site-specific DNA recombinase
MRKETAMRKGWARVSTREQNLDNQKRRLTEAGAERIYTAKTSGAKVHESAEWREFVESLETGDEVIVTKMDRLGRSSLALANAAVTLRDKGCDLVILDSPIDTTTPHGMLIYAVLAAIADFERSLIIDRTMDGLELNRASGNLRRATGGAPRFGWREPAEGEGDDWVRAEPAATALAEAATAALAGVEIARVYAGLVERYAAQGGLWTAGTDNYPARPLSEKMLRRALVSPASAGLIAEARDGDNGTVNIIGRSNAANPPLDEETWAALEGMFAGRRTGRRLDTDNYPLSPIMQCGQCGNQMSGSPRYSGPKGNRRVSGYLYRCMNPHKIGEDETGKAIYNKPCRNVSVDTEQVHEMMHRAVDGWAATSPRFAAAHARQAGAAAEVPGITADIAELDDMLSDAAERWYAGTITRPRYEAAKRGLETRRAALVAKLAAIKAEAVNPLPAEVDWENTSPASFRRLVTEAFATPLVVDPAPRGRAVDASERIHLAAA